MRYTVAHVATLIIVLEVHRDVVSYFWIDSRHRKSPGAHLSSVRQAGRVETRRGHISGVGAWLDGSLLRCEYQRHVALSSPDDYDAASILGRGRLTLMRVGFTQPMLRWSIARVTSTVAHHSVPRTANGWTYVSKDRHSPVRVDKIAQQGIGGRT